jgi:hypothetical protein
VTAGKAPIVVPPSVPEALRPAVAEAFAFTGTEWGSSRWGEYRRCPQAHHLRYHLRVSRTPASAQQERDEEGRLDYFALGNLVHAARGYFELTHDRGGDWRHVLEVARAQPDADPLLVAEADRLLGGYFARWGEANAGWPEGAEIVSVERLYEHEWPDPDHGTCPSCDGTGSRLVRTYTYRCATCSGTGGPRAVLGRYSARLDTVLRIDGSLVIADTKTRAKRIPSDRAHYERGLRTNPQFLGQSWLVMTAEGLDEPPPVWVNAIVKTKVPDYDRLLVRFTRADVDRWAANQRELSASGCDLRTMNYSQCAPEMGSRCWAFDWCHGSEESRALHFKIGESAEGA